MIRSRVLTAEALTMFHPRVAVHRWVGDVEGSTLLAPQWGLSKLQILEALGTHMRERGLLQGQQWTPTSG